MPNQADPASVLAQFFHDMWEWETSCRKAAERHLGTDADARSVAEFCLQARNEVLARYCATSTQKAALVMGRPLHYTPNREVVAEIVEVTPQARVVIKTRCGSKEPFFAGSEWKYELNWDGLQWRIGKRWARVPEDTEFKIEPLV